MKAMRIAGVTALGLALVLLVACAGQGGSGLEGSGGVTIEGEVTPGGDVVTSTTAIAPIGQGEVILGAETPTSEGDIFGAEMPTTEGDILLGAETPTSEGDFLGAETPTSEDAAFFAPETEAAKGDTNKTTDKP